MRIYWFKAQAPQRVLALVKHLHIHAELVELDLMGGDLKKPEYAALNPNMKAPVMVDGDTVLWESSAIMAYLCIKARSDMWPANSPAEQVEVLRWLSWNDCHWSSAISTHYFQHIVKATFGIGSPDLDAVALKLPELRRFAKVLDDHLANRTWVACGRLTIADFQLGSMASYWRTSNMPFESFPNLIRWLDGLTEIPAWANPWPVINLAEA